MFQSILDFFVGLYQTPWGFWTILLYWIPVLICLVGYLFEFVRDYKADVIASTETRYDPKLTVGSLLGRLVVSIIPLCNLGLAIFKHAGKIIKNVIQAFADWLDIPFVRHRPDPAKSNNKY